MEYAVSQFGRVDILVNGAAGNFLSEAKSLTPKGFKTVMDIDAQGTFNMCSAVYPAMAGNGGSIINISMTLHYGGKKMLCNVNFFISCVLFSDESQELIKFVPLVVILIYHHSYMVPGTRICCKVCN